MAKYAEDATGTSFDLVKSQSLKEIAYLASIQDCDFLEPVENKHISGADFTAKIKRQDDINNIKVIEAYHIEEPVPINESFTRDISVPKLMSETQNAKLFNEKINNYCQGKIDYVHKYENRDLIM